MSKKVLLPVLSLFLILIIAGCSNPYNRMLIDAKKILDASDVSPQDAQKALDLSQKVESAAPDNAQAYSISGRADLIKGDYDSAISEAQKALKINPNLKGEYYNPNFIIGYSYFSKSDYINAISYFNTVIKSEPDFAMAYNNRGYSYYCSSANDDATRSDYDNKAVADYTNAIKFDPKNYLYYYNRGLVYNEMENYQQYFNDMNQALKLKPNTAEIYFERAMANFQLNNDNAAFSDFDKAIQLDPQNAGMYYERGLSYYISGDMEKAKADRLKAASLDVIYSLGGASWDYDYYNKKPYDNFNSLNVPIS